MTKPKTRNVAGYELIPVERTRLEALIALPDDDEGCWDWVGAFTTSVQGVRYARFWLRGRHRSAGRLVFEMFKGVRLGARSFARSCGNGMCVNPDHVTTKQFSPISSTIQTERCANGHLRAEWTVIYPSGRRACRACVRATSARAYQRKVLLAGGALAQPAQKKPKRTWIEKASDYLAT